MKRLPVSLLLAAALAACGEASTSNSSSEAQRAADALTGDSKGEPSDNALCKLFTPDELAVYAGEPLDGPRNAAMGSGCQWPAKDGEGEIMLQVVPKRYHRNTTMADGYKKLPDLGLEGNVSPDMGDWIATTIVGEDSVIASVAGKSASAAQAAALLRETIKRRGGSP